jgi:hypothetical protein
MRGITSYRPSHAMVVAFIALLLALGSGAYAQLRIPRNSVGNAQLKRNAVTSPKVKAGSLLRSDFRRGQIPAGPRGPAGPEGPRGATGERGPAGTPGAPGAPGATNVVTRTSSVSAPVGVNDFSVACLPGEKAVGGGGTGPASDPEVTLAGTFASPAVAGSTPTGWTARYNVTGIAHMVTTFVVCASP